VWRDGKDSKEFEICTAGLEFESGHTPLERVWDSQGFIYSPEPIKYALQGVCSNQKKSSRNMLF
jgi:hypothetical protein